MQTQNIVLIDSQAQYIEQLVAFGRYPNANEVLREGLRLVERLGALDAARLVALREAMRVGDEDIARPLR